MIHCKAPSSSILETYYGYPLRNTSMKQLSQRIQHCKNMRELKQIHCQILTSPNIAENDQFHLMSRLLFSSALSDLGSGSLNYATSVFCTIKNPNLYLYNIMIRAYASDRCGSTGSIDNRFFRVLVLYKQMLSDGIVPDCLTFPFMIKDCTKRLDDASGQCIHAQVIKYGFFDDIFVVNSMINMYSAFGLISNADKLFDGMLVRDIVSWNSMLIGYLRNGGLDKAFLLFKKMERKNIVTWNSIITGFVQGGRDKEALQLFHEMQVATDGVVKPDKITVASDLSACASLGAIDHGRWLHGYLERSGLECDVVIGTSLVDMYGKCGHVARAFEIFRDMHVKDAMAWTAMISSFALHGFSKDTFDCFFEMEAAGVKPNHVTFVGLLSACAHSGLVERGRWCFNMMKSVYSIEPQVYHYACMVDILSRAGLLNEAEILIRTMPMKPDVFVWGALLGGCQIHGNVELGEKVAHYLVELEPLNHAFYINLCEVYAKAGKLHDVKRIRTLMKERNIKKDIPGCSMIEVDGVVHEFSVSGSPNFVMDEVLFILNDLNDEMKSSNMCEQENN